MARILAVDDERINLRLVQAALENHGHQVIAIQTPAKVPALMEEGSFDAVVVDILMPEVTGWDLLARLRNHPKTRDLPIVMLSGYGDTPTRVRGIRSGADDFLVKPFHPDELLARLESLIQRKARAFSSGTFESDDMLDLIERLAEEAQTGAVHILAQETAGCLILDKGDLVKATFGARRGLPALETILDLERGLYQCNHMEKIPECDIVIREPIDSALQNFLWMKAEINSRRWLQPDDDHKLRPHGFLGNAGSEFATLPLSFVHNQVQENPGITPAEIRNSPQHSPCGLELACLVLLELGSIQNLDSKDVPV